MTAKPAMPQADFSALMDGNNLPALQLVLCWLFTIRMPTPEYICCQHIRRHPNLYIRIAVGT